MNPVEIRGVIYKSAAEAARAIGVHQSTIGNALDRGTIDRCGMSWGKPRPCEINGVSYDTLTAAAKDIGVSVEAIRQRMDRAQKRRQRTGKQHDGWQEN